MYPPILFLAIQLSLSVVLVFFKTKQTDSMFEWKQTILVSGWLCLLRQSLVAFIFLKMPWFTSLWLVFHCDYAPCFTCADAPSVLWMVLQRTCVCSYLPGVGPQKWDSWATRRTLCTDFHSRWTKWRSPTLYKSSFSSAASAAEEALLRLWMNAIHKNFLRWFGSQKNQERRVASDWDYTLLLKTREAGATALW